ncbi:MAG: UvrB/UvrC motif-containing protein [Tannerellaceae bacterium]
MGDQSKSKEEETIYSEDIKINVAADPVVQYMSKAQLEKTIENTRKQMTEAAKKFEFIEAAQYRDELVKLEELLESKNQ